MSWEMGPGVVEFPDGVRVRARGLTREACPDPRPEWGLYLLASGPSSRARVDGSAGVTSGCPVTATTPAWPLQRPITAPRPGLASKSPVAAARAARNRAGVHCAARRRAGWRRDRLGPIPLRPPCRRDTLAAAVCAALPHGRPSEPGVAGRRRAHLTPNAPVLGPTSFSPLLPSRSSLSHRHETGSTRLHADSGSVRWSFRI
jgi:hypothetical protein